MKHGEIRERGQREIPPTHGTTVHTYSGSKERYEIEKP